jgi:hypothetical protein
MKAVEMMPTNNTSSKKGPRKKADLPLPYVGLSNTSRKLREQNKAIVASAKGKRHIDKD